MTTVPLDHVADLIAALHRDDADRIARALIGLEAHFGPDEIADIIAGITAEEPSAARQADLVPGPVDFA